MDFQLRGGVSAPTPTLFKGHLYSLKITELEFRTPSLVILTLLFNVSRSDSFSVLHFLHLWNELLGFNQVLKSVYCLVGFHMSKGGSYHSAQLTIVPRTE